MVSDFYFGFTFQRFWSERNCHICLPNKIVPDFLLLFLYTLLWYHYHFNPLIIKISKIKRRIESKTKIPVLSQQVVNLYKRGGPTFIIFQFQVFTPQQKYNQSAQNVVQTWMWSLRYQDYDIKYGIYLLIWTYD